MARALQLQLMLNYRNAGRDIPGQAEERCHVPGSHVGRPASPVPELWVVLPPKVKVGQRPAGEVGDIGACSTVEALFRGGELVGGFAQQAQLYPAGGVSGVEPYRGLQERSGRLRIRGIQLIGQLRGIGTIAWFDAHGAAEIIRLVALGQEISDSQPGIPDDPRSKRQQAAGLNGECADALQGDVCPSLYLLYFSICRSSSEMASIGLENRFSQTICCSPGVPSRLMRLAAVNSLLMGR